jgi:hypothetical protein
MSGHNQTFYKLKAKQFKNKEEVLEWADQHSESQERKKQELRETIAWCNEQDTRQKEEIAELKRRLKMAETLSCECCGEIDEEDEFRKNGGRFVDEWCCYACPKCVPASFDIEAADRLIEKLQKMKSEAMGVADPEKQTAEDFDN